MVFSQEFVSERIAEQIVDVSEDEEIVNAVHSIHAAGACESHKGGDRGRACCLMYD